MAKVYSHNGDIGLRDSEAQEAIEPIPAGVTPIEFDEDTNADLISDLQRNASRYSIAAAVLRKNGVAVTIIADSDRITLKRQATQALTDNDAFVALASPSNAQNAAQIKALTRQMNRVIRVLLWVLKILGR